MRVDYRFAATLNLAPRPDEEAQLTEEDLEQVIGGKGQGQDPPPK